MTTRAVGYRTTSDLCRGLGAAAVLATFTLGVPFALLAFGGDPRHLLPDEWPQLTEVREWPTQAWHALRWAYYDGSLVPTVLQLVAWTAWLVLVWMVLAELAGQLRHGAATAAHHRFIRVSPRSWICSLVAALLVLISPPAQSPSQAASAQTVATVHHDLPIGRSTPQTARVETVRPPAGGVYDTLWHIAERRLGAGSRWPEIWAINEGQTQVDGRVFTDPNLIHPGWQLRLPEMLIPPAPPQQDQDAGEAPLEPSSPAPMPQPDPTSPSQTAPPIAGSEHDDPPANTGITVGTGAIIGLGLAALITAAMFTVRLKQRRQYRPGSGERDNLTTAPVVRNLRIAYNQATLLTNEDGTPIQSNPSSGTAATRTASARIRAQRDAAALLPVEAGTAVGVRDGQTQAIHLARTRGLGLIGPGGPAALRALLVALLADAHRDPPREVNVLIPIADVHALVDDAALLDQRPTRLHVVESLDAALNAAETALLTQARQSIESPGQPDPTRSLVLIGTPVPRAAQRLQAVLDNGSSLGVAGLLLGPWRSGITALVQADGMIASSTNDSSELPAGTRLFTLPSADTRSLLDLLGAADTTDDPSPTLAETSTPPSDDVFAKHQRTNSAPGKAVANASPLSSDGDGTDEVAGQRPLSLRVLGRVDLVLHHDGEQKITGALTPKQREIVVYLALHPQGVRREALNEAIWPDSRSPRLFNSLHNALSLLRRALTEATDGAINDIIRNDDGHFRLDDALVGTDYERFQRKLLTRRSAGCSDDHSSMHGAIELYRGDLADDLTAHWIEPFRESVRRDTLDILGSLIRTHREADPEVMLALLERAREIDPYNEVIYRNILRTQARLGRQDAMPRTLALLTTALRDIDQKPSRETLELVEFLQRRRAARRADRPDTAAS